MVLKKFPSKLIFNIIGMPFTLFLLLLHIIHLMFDYDYK